MGFEKAVDHAVNRFALWTLEFEVIIGVICASICFVVGCRYLKKDKKNAGYIWCGIGVLIILLDVVKAYLIQRVLQRYLQVFCLLPRYPQFCSPL